MRRLLVTSGAGPVEVRRFVAQLAAVLVRTGATVIARVGPEASPRSVTVAVAEVPTGWLGTHVLVDPSRGRGGRRRWYAGVSEVEGPDEAPSLDPRDVALTACRAGGPGGQHVNTSATAVRAVHRPTGVAVRVQSERSQAANRRRALARLAAVLGDRSAERRSVGRAAVRATHHRLVRGAPVRTWRHDRRGALVSTDARLARR